MYTNFFSLIEKPFSITPDPAYLFLSKRHEEALAHLIYGVTDSGGFIQLTGEVGTGKTTIIRSLFNEIPDNVSVALILNPRLSVNEFLHSICDELGLALKENPTNKQCIDVLNPYLLKAHAQGRKVVLLVDEAQNLSVEVLEQIRLLTNLETHKDKLLQIILVGQPELQVLLERKDLRQLAQRITARYYLLPLNKVETSAYIKHRLKIAGANYDIFRPGAELLIFKATQGIPRLINVISDRALLGAFSQSQPMVNAQVAKQAIKEVLGDAADSIKRESVTTVAKPSLLRFAWIPVILIGALFAWQYLPMATWLSQLKNQTQTAAVSVDKESVSKNSLNTKTVKTAEIVQNAATLKSTKPSDLVAVRNDSIPVNSKGNKKTSRQAIAITDLLSEQNENTLLEKSFNQLLLTWNRTPFYEHTDACENLKIVGLRCLYQQGSWENLLKLDRPVILELVDDKLVTHQVLVKYVTDENVIVAMPNKEYLVSIADIQSLWKGSYLVFWQPANSEIDSLFFGIGSSNNVLWLREQLSALNFNLEPNNKSTYFDEKLDSSVKKFQASVDIDADGIVGSRTFIMLNSILNLPNRPTLVEGSD